MTQGYSLSEIANELGQQASWVSERLASLRNELSLAAGRFFPLSETEYEALKESIRRHGIRSPILIGEHIACIDGRHRLLIAEELGIQDAPCVFLSGLDAEAERELALGLNAARRQLSAAQKRTLVESELHRNPARSDRLIGSICGCSHPFVAGVRDKLVQDEPVEATTTTPDRYEQIRRDPEVNAALEAPLAASRATEHPRVDPPQRLDASGRLQPAGKPARATPAPRRLAYLTCTHGQIHELYRDDYGDGYRLVASSD